MELLNVSVPEGGFGKVEVVKGGPVERDVVLDNVRASKEIEAPMFVKQPRREGSFIFVAGGPTVLDYLDEIRRRSESGEFICTSNKTYDFLIDKGIVPDACLILDPKEIVRTYVKKPHPKTTFYIATVCHPDVAGNLLKEGIKVEKMMVGYGLEDESDVELQRILYPENFDFLCGGTMAGLRAMNFAPMLGFSKCEYYGFDSCFSQHTPKLIHSDDPRFDEVVRENKGIKYEDAETGKEYAIDDREGGFYYAYSKRRGENILVAQTPDGRRFYTSPVFAHQAKQAIKWIDRLEDKVEIVVHGDSLTSHLLKCHREAKEKALAGIGDRRWTEGYAKLQRELHAQGHYGTLGDHDTELVGRAILGLRTSLKRNLSVLDYGCGNGSLARELSSVFNCIDITKYDPFQEEYSKEPEGKFDIVTCFDVMEHVEEQCVLNTLKYIADRTRYMAAFSIALSDAIKDLPDGRNAHITQHRPEWWVNRIGKYFQIAEIALAKGEQIIIICQSLDAVDTMREEKQ